jgi:hypothetical protein
VCSFLYTLASLIVPHGRVLTGTPGRERRDGNLD